MNPDEIDDLVKGLYIPICGLSEHEFRKQMLGEWTGGSSSGSYTGGSAGLWGEPTTIGQPYVMDHTISDPPYRTMTDYNYNSVEIYDWTDVPGEELGMVYIEGDEIKLKTRIGKVVTIGRLDDSEDFLPIEVIAAKKKLLEDPEPQ